ncbi:MAG: stage II sporulation protein M [Clostridia bacterium]|nr:stage II sporulation protein M [Clostridia bacterium]
MKIKTIRFNKKAEFTTEQEKMIKNMIITVALFAAGVIIGAGIMGKGSSNVFLSDFKSVFTIFINKRTDLKFYEIFFNSFIINFVFIAAVFCAGLSCIGLPVVISAPVIKGIGYGMLSGYLLTEYSMNGVGYYLLTILPSGVMFMAILLLASSSAWILSKELLAIIFEKKQPDSTAVITYIKRYAVYFAGTVLTSAVETVFIKAFAYLFTF